MAGKPIEFRAGKMKLDGRMLRPDARKGLVKVLVSAEDQLLHLTWTSRLSGVTEENRIIFPGEASYTYVEQARGNAKNPRVYLLNFSGSGEKLFFWMQEPDASKDEELCKSINARINGEEPTTSGAAQLGGMDQSQLLAMLTGGSRHAESSTDDTPPQAPAPDAAASSSHAMSDAPATPAAASTPASTPAVAAVPAAPAAAAAASSSSSTVPAASSSAPRGAWQQGAGGAISTSNLAAILSNLGQGGGGALSQAQAQAMKGASLSDVLESKGLLEALAGMPQDVRASLMEELPDGDKTEAGLREVVRSPQLAQAIGQLDHVLQSGQGRELLLSMGIPPAQGFETMGPAAIRAFLREIQKQEDANMKQ